jgi:hypothetical protein
MSDEAQSVSNQAFWLSIASVASFAAIVYFFVL